jgi:KDO2-lipid IV(A) lauroyltransferase
MKNSLANMLINLTIYFFKLFDRSQRQKMAKFIARKILRHAKKTKSRAMSNISLALPTLSAIEVEALALESYENIVCGIFECFWLDEVEIDIECDEATLELLHNEKGAAVATMHMSCYEIAPIIIERLVGNATTMSKIPAFITSASDIYKKSNIKVINSNAPHPFIELLRATKENNVICLHTDHFSTNVPVTFFGRKTSAPSGIAMVSAYQKVPLLICYATLQANGRYKAVLETVTEVPVENNELAITQAIDTIYQRFEEIIRIYPEQWYWSYNRWRN